MCRAVFSCLFIILSGGSCLPLDTVEPECFPQEGCGRGLICVEGECIAPQEREVFIDLTCLSGDGCSESLSMYQVGEVCLIIEQPYQLLSAPIAFDQARFDGGTRLTLPLMTGPLRASALLFNTDATLTSSEPGCKFSYEDIDRYQLHRGCVESLGCVMRLRSVELEVGAPTPDPLQINFGAESGQCAERSWSSSEPTELCDGGDHDCDGFIDEGARCE